jgi:hypothetical protein
MFKSDISLNPNSTLDDEKANYNFENGDLWINKDTTILVVHGIGNQLPLETLDQFARGLIPNINCFFLSWPLP